MARDGRLPTECFPPGLVCIYYILGLEHVFPYQAD